MRRDVLARLVAARAARRTVVLATEIPGGRQTLLELDTERPADLPPPLWDAALRASAADRSGVERIGDGDVFLHAFVPATRLVVVGAVHIAQALVPMATLCGLAVTVVDPRGAFATPERFPGVELSTAWPDDALAALAPDRRTAVVTLTHDPKLDDPALVVALRSPAFFIGSLGSRKTHEARRLRLLEEGFTQADLARIHGPVGLSIGARTPAEIAVSILAQLVATMRGPAA
jgi:xanthine dehydrogenase accessory factor